ncbi:restriction endonuclease subunit S [Brevibacillus composti]|uniref:Restriction endonuclease subunit S n=1 Tax=Brevibacillus composti TaxID=2796470 RepID=A0A7T5JP45_9BACL|nr:restriction endonuclease subunit S [Brevibacillus composti]QQE74731.1 restriction endonuclease subunit S [Brevibacillus composti]QUO41815.1 restriction endonuclease subunit S [Brevibacillus composti]
MKYKIRELCKRITSGGTPSRTEQEKYFVDGTINWVKTQELRDCNVNETEEKITEIALKESSAKLLPRNTVSMAMYGATVGKLGILKTEMATNQACCNMVVEESKADYKFLFYSLLNNRKKIISLANGAAQQNLNLSIIGDFEIDWFPLEEQREISGILSAMDAKIELNNAINKNLEEMAQTLFKRWFVDFEFPNENGEPYKSSGGEFEESELGLIPKGWKVGRSTDIFDVLSGGTPKTSNPEYWNGVIPFFTPKDCLNSFYVINTEKTITEVGLNNCNSKLYKTDTVFITARGTVGKVSIAGRDMAMNQSCYALIAKNGFTQKYIFLQTKQMISALQKNANGAVFDAITVSTFQNLKTLVPNIQLVRKFDEVINNIFLLILEKTNEIQYLQGLRDTLLPKLMSGEIRVPVEQEYSHETQLPMVAENTSEYKPVT